MTRTLLINSNRYCRPGPVIPFGLCCVATACEQAGHEMRLLDLCFARNCRKAIRQAVTSFAPDVVGIGIRNIDDGVGRSTHFHLEDVRSDVVGPVKDVFGGPVVIGGAAVGINAREMLEFFDLEFAVRGDGETTMARLLDRWSAGQPWDGTPGLVVHRAGQIVDDQPPDRIPDLDRLPRPQFHKYVDLKAYRRFDSPLQIQTKRGCALRCVYCVYNQVEGHEYRLRDPLLVADEIESLVRETGINHIEFIDSTFNIPLDHAKAVLRAVIAKRMDLQLRTMGLNPGSVDGELVDLLQQAGFSDVDVGAESACDVTLKALGENYTKDAVLRRGNAVARQGPGHQLVHAAGRSGRDARNRRGNARHHLPSRPLERIGLHQHRPAPLQRLAHDTGTLPVGPDRSPGRFPPTRGLPAGRHLHRGDRADGQTRQFDQPNFLIVPDDETITPRQNLSAVALLRRLKSRQPVWPFYIYTRRMEAMTGLTAIKRWLWQRKQNRHQ